MAGIGLTEVFRVLGEQANEEVHPGKSRSLSPASHDRTLGASSTSYRLLMHLMLYTFNAITKLCHGRAGLAGLSNRSDPLVPSASGPCVLAGPWFTLCTCLERCPQI